MAFSENFITEYRKINSIIRFNNFRKIILISEELKEVVQSYKDFPIEGINFRDILPVFQKPELVLKIVEQMSKNLIWEETDAIIAVDARGFLFGTCVAQKLRKPLIVARKKGKLPGPLLEQNYSLEYGKNSLAIQKDAVKKYETFGIIDDLLATGGTVKCIENIIKSVDKKVNLLSVVIELSELSGRSKFSFEVDSQLIY